MRKATTIKHFDKIIICLGSEKESSSTKHERRKHEAKQLMNLLSIFNQMMRQLETI